MPDIAAIGAGYLGLLTSVCWAQLGHRLAAMETAIRENILTIYPSSLAEPQLTSVTRNSTG